MAPEITVQLYSVREQAAADYRGTIEAIAAMGFGCVEPAGYPGTTPGEAAELFASLGLRAPSCHGPLPLGDEKNRILDEAELMGHEAIITGCPPRFKEHYVSADEIKAMADLYAEAAENAAARGLQVGYHNHDWDMVEVDGIPGYRHFLKHTPDNVLYEADLFWVARAGLNPVEVIRELGSRGRFLHFKDGRVSEDGSFREAETEDGKIMVGDSKPFLPAGTGQVDLKAAASAAGHTRFVAVELDSYEGDMMNAIQESYTYLTREGIAEGSTTGDKA